MKALGLVGLLVLLQSLVGCAVNPATGRSDFVMMSEQQELAWAPVQPGNRQAVPALP